MASERIPTSSNKEITTSRLERHALQYVGNKGFSEIRGRFNVNYLYLEAIKELKGGLFRRSLGMDSVAGIGKLARLEYLGPNKWKFLIFDPATDRYVTDPSFQEGTVEECLDAAAKVFL